MTSFFPRILLPLRHVPWPVAWRRVLRFRASRPAPTPLDPEIMSAAQLRDLGLLDGRGPSHRHPERDPAAGP